jgi:hypothetical protein
MADYTRKERELDFIRETKIKLNSGNERVILSELKKLRTSATVLILPAVLDLFGMNKEEEVKKEILNFLAAIKDQKCVPVIAEYLSHHTHDKNLSKIIATCWHTGLDYSHHLNVFAECFIIGDYEQSLESFTVIEEMIWRSSALQISGCLEALENRISEISDEKRPLYNELKKILNEGASVNKNEFPDLYLN